MNEKTNIAKIGRLKNYEYNKPDCTLVELEKSWVLPSEPSNEQIHEYVKGDMQPYITGAHYVKYDFEPIYLRVINDMLNIVRIKTEKEHKTDKTTIRKVGISSQLVPLDGTISSLDLRKINKEGLRYIKFKGIEPDGLESTLIYHVLLTGKKLDDVVSSDYDHDTDTIRDLDCLIRGGSISTYSPYAEIFNPTSERVERIAPLFSEFVDLIENNGDTLEKISEWFFRFKHARDISQRISHGIYTSYNPSAVAEYLFEQLDKVFFNGKKEDGNVRDALMKYSIGEANRLLQSIQIPESLKSLNGLLRMENA